MADILEFLRDMPSEERVIRFPNITPLIPASSEPTLLETMRELRKSMEAQLDVLMQLNGRIGHE